MQTDSYQAMLDNKEEWPAYKASPTLLQASINTPDKDIPVPEKGQRTSSFAAVVTDLEVGQHASRVVRVDPNMKVGELTEGLRVIKDTLRNAISSTVAAAKRRTSGTYSIELGDVVMPGGSIFVVAVITRLD